MADFLEGLIAAGLKAPQRALPSPFAAGQSAFQLRPAEQITITRLIARLNPALDDSTVVIADTGDAMFASSDLVIHRQTEFLSPAYYTSMGFAVPAALGVMVARPELRPIVLVGDGAFQMTGTELSSVLRYGFCPVVLCWTTSLGVMVARPELRPIVLVGDGAFQMTGTELSSLLHYGFSPLVIVLDNLGYGTERLLQPGEHAYNDIHPWRYSKLPELLGGGVGYEVATEGEFDAALCAALADRDHMSLIQVHLDRNDRSEALERLAARLGPKV